MIRNDKRKYTGQSADKARKLPIWEISKSYMKIQNSYHKGIG
jgi:hypothetical protein